MEKGRVQTFLVFSGPVLKDTFWGAHTTGSTEFSCHHTELVHPRPKKLQRSNLSLEYFIILLAKLEVVGWDTLDMVLSISICLEAFSRKPGLKRFASLRPMTSVWD